MKTLTTIPQGSRAKRLEKRRISPEIVIWSDLHGDMQQLERAGSDSRPLLNTMSIDLFLGLPFNIASYGMLMHMLCHVLGMNPGELIITFGDLHIYQNHVEQVKLQLTRQPRDLPRLRIIDDPETRNLSPLQKLLALKWSNIEITGYNPHPAIAAPVSV